MRKNNSWACARRALHLVACAAGLIAPGPSAQAAWPERPINLLIPFSPGGPPDIIARILQTSLGQALGQQLVIDNRAGAAGNIAMGQVARAKPDGYTLM